MRFSKKQPEQKRRKKTVETAEEPIETAENSVGNCLDKTCDLDTFRVESRATVLHLELDWCSWMVVSFHQMKFLKGWKTGLLRMQHLGFPWKRASVKALVFHTWFYLGFPLETGVGQSFSPPYMVLPWVSPGNGRRSKL
jgi:hypothetical protein